MRRHRNAKIVATLGPASSDAETIRALVVAGADVFRLNFSHGNHDDHRQRLDMIRAIEADLGRPIGVMMDLQGPKLRVGRFADGPVDLKPGDRFRLDLDDAPGDRQRVRLPHPEIFAALKPGDHLLINDGRVRLMVVDCDERHADTEVVVGGEVSDNKGVNVPDTQLALSALTDKDREDLVYGLELGVDWVALSFVQKAEDVEELRGLVGERAAIIVKLEKPGAIDQLEAIVEATDAVMVARGDLGVELPPEEIPHLQKRIISACRRAGKPVVVATHMLDSMVDAPVPTRAEVSDVANAVYDGADAVMLSAESAAGRYPVPAVDMMDRILRRVEHDPHYRRVIDAGQPEPRATSADAVCCALRRMGSILSAAVTVTYTSSGYSCLRTARERPEMPILGLTPNAATARRLALVWGTHPVLVETVDAVEDMVETARRVAVDQGFATPGQALVVAAGMPFGQSGTTNLVRVAWA
jgi:pyruvate kinase